MKETNPQDSGEKWGTQWTSRSDAAVAQQRAEKRAAEEKVASQSGRWGNVQPSKTMLIWSCIGAVLLTLLIGFQFAGWRTAAGAEEMAATAADAAVVEKLAPICVAQFNLDPDRDQKLVALRESSTYQRAGYVTDQQWATMPGDEEPLNKVAEACARLLMDIE